LKRVIIVLSIVLVPSCLFDEVFGDDNSNLQHKHKSCCIMCVWCGSCIFLSESICRMINVHWKWKREWERENGEREK
jgi:hypothetical protein